MSETLSKQLASRVRKLRIQREWSHDQLAIALNAVGVPWTRQVVAKLENGRRQTLTLEELQGLALVFDVPPLVLLYPAGQNTTVEILPGQAIDAQDAARWFTGETRLPLSPNSGAEDYLRESTGLEEDPPTRCTWLAMAYMDATGTFRVVEIPTGNQISVMVEETHTDPYATSAEVDLVSVPIQALPMMFDQGVKVTVEARHGSQSDGVLLRAYGRG
jgi:transcriptional regulator with XRE-family HTH domain